MNFTIRDKVLTISEGTSEIRFKDINDILEKAEIEEIILPSTIEIICDNAFFDHPNIRKINIPTAIQHIGSQAFWGLDDLEELTVPITIQSVGKHAFCNCTKLKLIIDGKKEDIPTTWDKEFAANIKEIHFLKSNSQN